MTIDAHLVKAFTKDPKQGNPAGVIQNADKLTDQQSLLISSQLGFSESAFVSSSNKASFRVKFFTPQVEVPLCGHGTIATFHVLREQLNLTPGIYTQETQAGILEVELHDDGLISMRQQTPKFWKPVVERSTVALLLNLQETDLISDLPVQLISTGGAPKLMIPIKNLSILQSIKPNLLGISTYCRSSDVRGFYPFTYETINPQHDFHARQFNPLAGIDEDPITGIAGGALACYARKHDLTSKNHLVIEQGYILNKGGNMYIKLDDEVKVGGHAVQFDIKQYKID